MVEEGYQENQAIPIATEQAKEWYDNATEAEKQEIKQKTDQALRATDHERSSRPELLDHGVHVLPDGDEWIVKTAHAEQAANRYQVKEEAIERGKEIAKNKGEQLAIHKQSGQIQDVLSY